MLISPPGDLGRVGARHLELISEDLEVRPLIGRQKGAASASTGEGSYGGRSTPPLQVNAVRDASQLAAAVAAVPASESELGQSFWQRALFDGLLNR